MKTKHKKIKEVNKTKNHRKAVFILLVVILIIFLIIITYDFTVSVNGTNSSSGLATTSPKISSGAGSLNNDKILPRHIFYHSPRVFPNPGYSSTCYPAGEIMYASPGNKCCDGLKALPIIDEAEQDCKFLVGASLCSDCGNKRCEYGENKCNCPSDCKKK